MTSVASIPTQHGAGNMPGKDLVHALAEALHGAVSVRANTTWTSRVLPQTQRSPSAQEPTLTASARLSGAFTGGIYLSLDPEVSSALLDELSSASSGNSAQTWLTLCSAAGEMLLGSPKPAFTSLGIEAWQLAPLSVGSEPLAQLELITPGGTPGANVTVSADADLLKSLANPQIEARTQTRATGEDEEASSTQIERVIDVPLAVTLRFGQRHLTLREVLALSTGSLVELDRQVEEPVELVLGDRLIARGEVVIVDGNYGLRVTEIVQEAAHRIRRAQAANAGEAPTSETTA